MLCIIVVIHGHILKFLQMLHNSNLEDDEIDLGELFAALWAYKLLIPLFTALSFLADIMQSPLKKFMAKSIFKLSVNSSSNFNLPGELEL